MKPNLPELREFVLLQLEELDLEWVNEKTPFIKIGKMMALMAVLNKIDTGKNPKLSLKKKQ